MNKRDKQKTKETILLAAKKEFANCGFNGARMTSIAKKANANQALIHYYFSSKENLYTEVIKEFSHVQNYEQLAKEFDKLNLSVSERLLAKLYSETYFNVRIHDFEINLIIHQGILENRKEVKFIMDKYFSPMILNNVILIKKGINENIFETSNPTMVVFAIHDFIIGRIEERNFLKQTNLFNQLYGENTNDEFLSIYHFAKEMLFKMLKPANKDLTIPKLDNTIYLKLENIINSLCHKNTNKENQDD